MNAAILVLLALLANCAPDRAPSTPPAPAPVVAPAETTAPTTTERPVCADLVITLDGFEDPIACNVNPPSRIDVRLDDPPTPGEQLDCDNSGGSVTHDPTTGTFTCQDLDY